MASTSNLHTFHIPVMGTGFTIDSPLKVARFGISSVVSIIDHRLIELVREYYSKQFGKNYTPIDEYEPDGRANQITAYLNFLHDTVNEQLESIKKEPFEPHTEITKYFELLPETSPLKIKYLKMLEAQGEVKLELQEGLRAEMKAGSIDVNVMTKLDKDNKNKKHQDLPIEFNDAHAAVRGFAKSKLNSSVVFSAGMNPKLYGYVSEFTEFLPESDGTLNKRIVLKVSDFRSALIQGKFLAKKGLWVSEYRIESGLNCGGHAFATDGYLMGPILNEFKHRKEELQNTLYEIYTQALYSKGVKFPPKPMDIYYSAQGGVGNAEEHNLLHDVFGVKTVGWGSPFLLVPEAVNIDGDTLNLLKNAGEDDFYLSNISPLGVRFNTVKGTSAEEERLGRIAAGKPGAPCYKKHLVSNTEYTTEPICSASNRYQSKKIAELTETIEDKTELQKAIDKVIEKTCLCVGLANGAMTTIKAKFQKGMPGIVVCPGPNLAYFTKEVSLHDMVDHVYGRKNVIDVNHRPHMFLKELGMYVDFLNEKIGEIRGELDRKQTKYFQEFTENLNNGIEYYIELINDMPHRFGDMVDKLIYEINEMSNRIHPIPMPVEVMA